MAEDQRPSLAPSGSRVANVQFGETRAHRAAGAAGYAFAAVTVFGFLLRKSA